MKKKIVILMALAMTVLSMFAEKRTIPLNRNYNAAGTAVILSRTEDLSDMVTKAMSWELKNDPIGGENYITLRVYDMETGHMDVLASWKDGENLLMVIDEEGRKSYVVSDNDFVHLILMPCKDVGDGKAYVIRLCSVLRE